ncbi:katanin p60 ATPase-containing subunit A1 [Gossypium australe]|uniref:Katanin p60 ATPase-containing subunit A1 n=1 Tax=Gossypium australe TaxID=47621 RepID=A0A5B6W8L5_9ROSI|nr:katanin p60 ATPase-containing subunit A1 [Gossypium australe]
MTVLMDCVDINLRISYMPSEIVLQLRKLGCKFCQMSYAGSSLQDFKLFYDAKFGRKRLPEPQNGQTADELDSNGTNSNVTSKENHPVRNTSDMAIYEQYRNQVLLRSYFSVFLEAFCMFIDWNDLLLFCFDFRVHTRCTQMARCLMDLIRDRMGKTRTFVLREFEGFISVYLISCRYFTGLLSPWKGILLFGPPGTGKVYICQRGTLQDKHYSLIGLWECQMCSVYGCVLLGLDPITFIVTRNNTHLSNCGVHNISGDSEKLIKVLFDLARHHAPSTIFLDEIDAIISQRGGEGRSEHEASRRLKTELLIQMDGLTRSDELVFVLAATNLPWELDAAMLRRLEKRILVPLPEPEARKAMFEELLPQQHGEEALPYDILVERSEGYSGSDIRLLCKEAAMQPLRRLMAVLEDNQEVVPEDGMSGLANSRTLISDYQLPP